MGGALGGPRLGCPPPPPPQPLELLDLNELLGVQKEGGALILQLRDQKVTLKVRGGQWGGGGGHGGCCVEGGLGVLRGALGGGGGSEEWGDTKGNWQMWGGTEWGGGG